MVSAELEVGVKFTVAGLNTQLASAGRFWQDKVAVPAPISFMLIVNDADWPAVTVAAPVPLTEIGGGGSPMPTSVTLWVEPAAASSVIVNVPLFVFTMLGLKTTLMLQD